MSNPSLRTRAFGGRPDLLRQRPEVATVLLGELRSELALRHVEALWSRFGIAFAAESRGQALAEVPEFGTFGLCTGVQHTAAGAALLVTHIRGIQN